MRKLKLFFGHTEYRMIMVAVAIIILNWVGGWFWEMNVVDPQKFAKIAYAIISISVGVTATWIWMNVFPTLKKTIDPDTSEKLDELTTWQKALLAVGLFIALLVCYTRLATS